jgi:hypothetical protein
MTELEDLKKRFEKNSSWILVNKEGSALKDEDCNDEDQERSIMMNSDSM